MDTINFRPDEDWISKALGISSREVGDAVATLQKINWLNVSEQGWEKCVGQTTSDPGDPRIKEARHALISKIAQKSLEPLTKFPREVRSHSANTVAINSSRLPEAIVKIVAFRAELAEFLGTGPEDEVYQVLVSVYPLS